MYLFISELFHDMVFLFLFVFYSLINVFQSRILPFAHEKKIYKDNILKYFFLIPIN